VPEALRAIMAEWTRTDIAYAARVDHIRNGGGLNGPVRFDATAVIDDGVKDSLSGGGGMDWFFAGVTDRVTDRRSPEIVTPESAPGAMAIDWAPTATALASSASAEKRSLRWVPEFTLDSEADAGVPDGLEAMALSSIAWSTPA
jgi:hypothetical protein